jgi:hypothetical protein
VIGSILVLSWSRTWEKFLIKRLKTDELSISPWYGTRQDVLELISLIETIVQSQVPQPDEGGIPGFAPRMTGHTTARDLDKGIEDAGDPGEVIDTYVRDRLAWLTASRRVFPDGDESVRLSLKKSGLELDVTSSDEFWNVTVLETFKRRAKLNQGPAWLVGRWARLLFVLLLASVPTLIAWAVYSRITVKNTTPWLMFQNYSYVFMMSFFVAGFVIGLTEIYDRLFPKVQVLEGGQTWTGFKTLMWIGALTLSMATGAVINLVTG